METYGQQYVAVMFDSDSKQYIGGVVYWHDEYTNRLQAEKKARYDTGVVCGNTGPLYYKVVAYRRGMSFQPFEIDSLIDADNVRRAFNRALDAELIGDVVNRDYAIFDMGVNADGDKRLLQDVYDQAHALFAVRLARQQRAAMTDTHGRFVVDRVIAKRKRAEIRQRRIEAKALAMIEQDLDLDDIEQTVKGQIERLRAELAEAKRETKRTQWVRGDLDVKAELLECIALAKSWIVYAPEPKPDTRTNVEIVKVGFMMAVIWRDGDRWGAQLNGITRADFETRQARDQWVKDQTGARNV